MFTTLFRKEVLVQILSSRFIFSLLVGSILMVGSTWVLVRNYEEQVRSYQAFEAEHARQIGSYETGADTRLDALSMGGRILDRRPPALSFLLAGIYQDLPKSFWVSNYDGPTPETSIVDNRGKHLFELVDFRFIVGVIFSLLALLLSYDAINGEKQTGTLRLTFANPVSIRHLLLAKWASLNVVLGSAFLASLGISLAIALANPSVSLGRDDTLRLLLIVVVSLLYLSVFVALGLLVSCLFREPYSAVAASLLVWVLLVFVVPGAAPYLAAAGEKAPDFVGTVVSRQDDLGYNYREIRQKHLDEGKDWQTASRLTNEQWTNVVEPELAANVSRANEEFLNRKVRLIERGREIARLSPYGSFSLAVTELAGVGVGGQLEFEKATERYRREFKQFIQRQEAQERHNEVSASDVPAFRFEPAAAVPALEGAAFELALLALVAVALFSASYLRMIRYDVR
jgi:ABC-type transport system involved in multi-copper enzyme maturation permease subunit